ncbi:cytoplasm protein [Trichosporon asahii var. asahii CBS 8904]|uniref:Cytoplasm protein n=1 Tax=Trichosporon asahii var. asahii (strain CBS 8904) TaxID=1220162 RepID=K1VE46_TRIAC|nr:cytoplasm protein [Trichosporon asahii var. asahii CBS 8904]
MDLYTTSFTFQRPASGVHKSSPLRTTLSVPKSGAQASTSLQQPAADAAQAEREWDAVQKLCNDITSREGCLVTVTREAPPGHGTGAQADAGDAGAGASQKNPADAQASMWNFHISGAYQAVMSARGALLRDTPRDNRTALKVPRSDILERPLAPVSVVKPDVKHRLDEIANDTRARIAVLNTEVAAGASQPSVLATSEPNSSAKEQGDATASPPTESKQASTDSSGTQQSQGQQQQQQNQNQQQSQQPSYGLETERMCELLISGSVESVELAKVRILVMLDELSGLHSEVCDIDYKLHAIIAGRKRCVIQSIQEETATNIYFPTPLVGVLDSPQPGSQQGVGYNRVNMAYGAATMSPQMTGMSYASNMSMGMSPVPPPHHNPHSRNTNQPVYNPQQHVHYPYSPQPLHINPQTTRGMPYTGPGVQQWSMHAGPGPHGGPPVHPGPHAPPHQQAPVQMTPTGMSGMNQMSNGHGPGGFGGRTMGTPMAHNQPMGQPMMGMSPMAFGQSHMHVGMGTAPMAGMPMNPGDMGMGQFGQGPHPGLSVHSGEQGMLGKANQIWITGEFFGVQRARDMLLTVAVQKSKLVISRDTAILPRKLDWLLTERIDDIRNIMCDNGTYIQVPSVGSQASLITVFGDHRVNIERTIRSVMALACQFYVASFWLLPVSFDVLMPQATLNPPQMQPALKRIAHETGAEVVFKSNCFEMHGLEKEVRDAVVKVLELDVIKSFHHEIRFQIELANEHREFISGKKNGKINKIMKVCGVRIKFETFNDYNFLMDISGQDVSALQGLSMLQEELPAEVSFHVPEGYHKRIIGVGGKNIQRIMKMYGVYVKFSNAEEFAQLGGYLDNEDNVVARTPAKNAIALESLKSAVMELVSPKDKDYTIDSVNIPRRYHRTLLGEKSIFIHDIERKTNSTIWFPNKETASDTVTIFGPESQVHIAIAMLLDHVPFEADLHVPPSAELTRLVSSTDFVLFTERMKRDHQIAIAPSARFGQGDEAIFKFRCQRSSVDFLSTVHDALVEFLAGHNIQVYPANAAKRVDSFADAFSHFDSKLLSTAKAEGEREERSGSGARARPSPTNVKALFDSGAPGSGAPGQQPPTPASRTFNSPLAFNVPEYWQGSVSTEKRGSDTALEDKLRMSHAPGHASHASHSGHPSHQSHQSHSGHAHTHSHPAAPHVPGHAHTLSHSHAHPPRAVGARTQSLDITHLNFARALGGPGSGPQAPFAPMPPSPTTTSSPNTSTGNYFPGGQQRYSSGDRTEGITQGLGNVNINHS